MANYNYVAPINYKSFSDMNKERLAAKAALDANAAADQAKKTSAVDKRRQDFLTKISGYKTAGWAEGHQTEYDLKIQQAKYEAFSNPNPDYISMADAILRMQELGDNHAELRKGQTQYESHMGENALEYEGDLPWGMTAIHDVPGYEERVNKFNNLGLINYNPATQLGDFPNADFDPAAPEGSPQSFRTIRQMVENSGGVIFNENGKDYVMIGEEKKQVNGNAFDVAPEGFGGLWNPTQTAINNFTAETAYFEFENKSGKAKFKTHATELNRRVGAGEITFEEAKTRLRNDVLSYLDPESPQADRALIASAITAYEKPTDEGGTGQDWDDVQGNETLLETYGAPWEFFANQIVDTADLDDPENPTKGGTQSEQDRRLLAFGAAPVETPDRQFARELGAEDFDWDEAFRLSERSQEILDLTRKVDVLDSKGRPTGETRRELKDLGEGVRVHMGQQDVKFDAVPIDNVEVFSDENLAIIYATGYKTGNVGINVGEEGDPGRYNHLFGGKEGSAPFRVINVLKADGSYTEDYKRLMNQFDRTYGYRNALQDKITKAEQARQ